jgi:hypothetical protein
MIFLLDFAKAFDHIDHKILLAENISSWIKNFLTEREQRAFVCPSGTGTAEPVLKCACERAGGGGGWAG